MAKVVTDNRHYSGMADALREMLPEETFRPEEMAEACTRSIAAARTEGIEIGEEACKSKHFAQIIPGSGTTELTFNVPFKVDYVSVICNDPDIRTIAHIVGYFEADLETLGSLVGKGGITSAANQGDGSYTNSIFSIGSFSQRFLQADDGTVTIKNVAARQDNILRTGTFPDGVDYLVVATKGVNKKAVKTRIEESVARIADTGTWIVYYRIDKLKEAYGDDYANNAEWTALMATKPNATFSLV